MQLWWVAHCKDCRLRQTRAGLLNFLRRAARHDYHHTKHPDIKHPFGCSRAVCTCTSRYILQVFMHYSELLNFLRAAVSLLGLPPDSGPAAVMNALGGLVEQAAM